jgi:hypothetical protein
MSVWLPIHPSSKACLVKGWSSIEYRGINPDIPRKWLGLRLDNLVVVDCDSEEAIEWWYQHVGVTTTAQRRKHTFTVKTKHGLHLYYVHTPGSPEASIIGKVHAKLDIKAGRGALVVVPPSPGYTELHDVSMRVFDPRWLPSVVRSDGTEEFHEIPDGQGNNTMFSIACKLRQLGFSVVTIDDALAALNYVLMARDPMPSQTITQIAMSAGRYDTSPDWSLEVS